MSKAKMTITDTVMAKIGHNRITMRPRLWFVVGSAITAIGLASSVIMVVFSLSLIRFSMRTHGPVGQYRLDQLLNSFPWWAPILAIVGLFTGIRLFNKYDISYRRNTRFIIAIFILSVILVTWFIELTRLDTRWFGHGRFRSGYGKYYRGINQPFQT